MFTYQPNTTTKVAIIIKETSCHTECTLLTPDYSQMPAVALQEFDGLVLPNDVQLSQCCRRYCNSGYDFRLGPSFETIDPRYLNFFTASSFSPLTVMSLGIPLLLFANNFVLFALISMP